ncbi:MAG: hypothetical protein ACP5UM_05795 [Anaerolineae bacterium]
MQSEIWLREDVLNALRAVAEAGMASALATSAPDSPFGQGYRQGFLVALRAMGAAFGLQTSIAPLLRLGESPDEREVHRWNGSSASP